MARKKKSTANLTETVVTVPATVDTTPKVKPGPASAYDPAWCDKVYDLATEGMTRCEIAFNLGISRAALYKYIKAQPAFAAALDDADYIAQSWWEMQGRRGIAKGAQSFNAHLFQFIMKNRWSKEWRDRQEIEHKGSAFKEFMAAVASGKAPMAPDRHNEMKDDANAE